MERKARATVAFPYLPVSAGVISAPGRREGTVAHGVARRGVEREEPWRTAWPAGASTGNRGAGRGTVAQGVARPTAPGGYFKKPS